MSIISELKQLDLTSNVTSQLEGWDERNRSRQLIAIRISDLLAVLDAGTEYVRISFDSLESLKEQNAKLSRVKAILVMLCGNANTSLLEIEQFQTAIMEGYSYHHHIQCYFGAEIDPEAKTVSGVVIGAR